VLQRESSLTGIFSIMNAEAQKRRSDPSFMQGVLPWLPQGLEAMINDGWVTASYDPSLPLARLDAGPAHTQWNRDRAKSMEN